MTVTFDQSQTEVARLVKQFRTNLNHYRAPNYKEAQARQDLIDPLFEALGWDVHNRQGTAPMYKEVLVEESLDIEGHQKAADYTFRVGREPIFYVEAKRPGISIKTAPEHAYQLRRYAWNTGLPLSILTDFEELAVYEGRVRPNLTDKVSVARVNFYTYEEYADRWREIWDVFSREAVLSGSFQQYAEAAKGKRGTSEVDAEFLKDISGWRELLARNLALRNAALSPDELNDAVQRTLDRLIFLRIAEDRGIEPYERLRTLTPTPTLTRPAKSSGTEEGGLYASLIDLFRAADRRYNSGLFDFSKGGDRWMLDLSIDDKVLKSIIDDLYYPNSPYRFNDIPVEILGNVYEQFLGKVIRLTAGHQAKVEEKPEVKKAGGVYYTPAYIVEYIVKQTVGKQVEGKSPKQLDGFRVLDMACGSGSFLLGAYQYLLDYYLQWYVAHLDLTGGAKAAVARRDAVLHLSGLGEWRLTVAEKKRILLAH
ncbi:MAG: N-6 DNA methylase, partial [Chloroflexi bacterium]|nr:N-6 DNA methylase [Chloroflexota bacterium]